MDEYKTAIKYDHIVYGYHIINNKGRIKIVPINMTSKEYNKKFSNIINIEGEENESK